MSESETLELAVRIVVRLRSDLRTKDLIRGSDASNFEDTIAAAIDEIQRERMETDSCCAFCGA